MESNPILFLDEIQNVLGWEKFARRMADSKHRVYITGSNAKMLSQDIQTTLGGRNIPIDVYPYSFNEFLTANYVPATTNPLVIYRGKSRNITEVQRLFLTLKDFRKEPRIFRKSSLP